MNPRSLHFMAACCRDASVRETDPIRREALENLAAYADRSAEARHAVKAVLAIYDAFPDAELSEVRVINGS